MAIERTLNGQSPSQVVADETAASPTMRLMRDEKMVSVVCR